MVCTMGHMDNTTDLIRPDTAARIHALSNLLERPAYELVAEAVEMLRHDRVPCTKPAKASAGRPRKATS